MITVEEAKELLFGAIEKSLPITLPLKDAYGFVLYEDLHSPIDLPLFDQSSMDGYAIANGDLTDNKRFKVIGEIKAGDGKDFHLNQGEAVRIFTGAAVPSSADGIIIQERVERNDDCISLMENFHQGMFIRRKGSQIARGDLALKKGTILNAASIGLLAALGIDKIDVYCKPNVTIIATGDEIVSPGKELSAGEIYESNSYMLNAALQEMRVNVSDIHFVRDEKMLLKERVQDVILKSDVVLITGGISVGKYDFVLEVLNDLGVQTIFYKVAQQPGKPLLAGKINDKWIFALPGNPASSLVCFYEYAYPTIRMISGIENSHLPTETSKLLKGIRKKEDRSQFIRAIKTDEGVMPLEGQDSGMLQSFAKANVLIYLSEETRDIKEGDLVEIHILPK
ncbi:MAG: gephyrin-like molybdotransferase Glp [Bacteroidota bacterium]